MTKQNATLLIIGLGFCSIAAGYYGHHISAAIYMLCAIDVITSKQK